MDRNESSITFSHDASEQTRLEQTRNEWARLLSFVASRPSATISSLVDVETKAKEHVSL